MSSARRNLIFGCPDIEKCLEHTDDSSNKVSNRDNLELAPPLAKVNTVPSAELDAALSSEHFGQVSALDQSNISKSAQVQGKTLSQPMSLGPPLNVPQA